MTTTTDAPAVELRHVTKRFDMRTVLDDVDLTIAQGRGFCLLGRSGTGKSVMLKHIIGLMTPDDGQVLVQGEDLAALSSRQIANARQRVGFLFQNAALFDSMTVGDNVAFPLRRHRQLPEAEVEARVRTLLARVGLERDYHKMPGDLSGGMRKRAGLARAIALDPPILLADEPSAGLDPVTAAEIDELLIGLKRQLGTTIVVVTHNIPSAKAIADELAFLQEGRIIARGSADELEQSEHPVVRQFMRSEGAG